MKVINLKCTNRGAIEACEIDVQGNSVVVSGDSGTGKTTLISMIWDLIEKNPKIRKGTNKETLEAYLETENGGFLLLKRVNDDKGNSKITITDENGESKPAAYAKTLLSEITKNPLALFEKTGNDRFDFLLKCSTVKIEEYAAKKIERARKAAERLAQYQLNETLQKRMGNGPAIVEPVDVETKQKELQGAYSHNQQVEKAVDGLEAIKQSILKIPAKIERELNEMIEIKKQIADLEKKISVHEVYITGHKAEEKELEKRIENAKEWLEENQPIDTTTIENELTEAAKINEQASAYKSWLEKRDELTKENHKWVVLEDAVKAIDFEISEMIGKMQFPIEGLTVVDEKILYNGIDYDSLGTSDQIMISAALTAQSIVNRKEAIHAIRIDRGESMSEATQQRVIETCAKIGVQCFISVVDRSVKDEKFTIDIVEVK